jgi:hypothetical protein
MSFDRARVLADAVLLEGYVLYPYRASAPKNRYRWAFGVLAPQSWSEAGGCESWWMESQCLVAVTDLTRIEARFRLLQTQHRSVQRTRDGGQYDPVESLDVDGRLLVTWDEGTVCEKDFAFDASSRAGSWESLVRFELTGGRENESLHERAGTLVGRVVRERWPMHGRIRIAAEPIAVERPLVRVRVRVENLTPWTDVRASRDAILRASFISSHLLFRVDHGEFVSLLDPPSWAEAAASACSNIRTFPVLVGERTKHDLVLSAPIILYDHAQVAPESTGDFYDATEIDELLALRTATLTEAEKREARATDPRSASLVDRVESLPRDVMTNLHGAIRDLAHEEMVPRVQDVSPSPRCSKAPPVGSRVRLRPGTRRTDAQDILFVGHTATVEQVLQDVDGREFLAVTIDDDPAAELHRWYGRFLHYYPDEVELLSQPEDAAP